MKDKRKQLDWDASLFDIIASTIEGIILLSLLPPEIRSAATVVLRTLSGETERTPAQAVLLDKLAALIEEVSDAEVPGVRR